MDNRDIDPLYFYVKPFFNWSQDVIFFNREDEVPGNSSLSLLRDMGVSARTNIGIPGAPQDLDAEVPADLSNLETRDRVWRGDH